MIRIPELRTNRLVVSLREIGMGDSIDVAQIHPDLHEQATTAFLRAVCESVRPPAGDLRDPAAWTVQERMFAVAHYLAAMEAAAGSNPDFALGESGHYSDYLDGEADLGKADRFPLGTVGEDAWSAAYLTGAAAEAIERIRGEIDGITGRLHWLVGAMTSMLVRDGEERPDPASGAGAYDDWLKARMRVILAYPGSDFEALLVLFYRGLAETRHLFGIGFDDGGIVALPKEGRAALPPVRFLVDACLPEFAQAVHRRSDGAGG
jgi:hypothetical protein